MDPRNEQRERMRKNWEARCEQSAPQRRRKRALFGLTVILFGTWWLLRKMNVEGVPQWATTWPVLLMGVGVVHLIGNGFRRVGGYLMVIIGAVFLLRNEYDLPVNIEPYFWPAVVILLGLFILFKPSSKHHHHWKKKRWDSAPNDVEDVNVDYVHTDDSDKLDALVIWGGIHKDIISKNFRGGEVTCIMGGAELFFGKADMASRAVIDVTIVMGGVKIMVPQNWNVLVNTSNILGGIDDKRRSDYAIASENMKTLEITGTVIMGGIDIQSY